MWLKSNWIYNELKYLKISSRLALIYAFMIAAILVIINIMTLLGLYYALYHQAEVSIDVSAKRTFEQIELKAVNDPEFGKETMVLLPGVILRIFDEDGNLAYDSQPKYFSMQWLEEHELEKTPIWADKRVFSAIQSILVSNDNYPAFRPSQYCKDNITIIQSNRAIIYRCDIPLIYNDKNYNMVFLQMVTAENQSLEFMKQLLLCADLICLMIALMVGYVVIKNSLNPVRDLNNTAKSIQVDDLSQRIEVSPANDELTELAITFNTMLDRLEAGFKAQQQFVSDASHELRTPLTVISGYADMLERWGNEDPEVLQESIAAIKSEAGDMQALIEKLLFLARADQKRQILKKEPVDMGEIVLDAAKKISMVAEQHEIALDRNEAGAVFADIITMRQLLRIFLENAMKYTPAGGHITIAGYVDKEYNKYIIEIADDGIGIAKEDQPKIFQRFYRVDSSRTKAAGTPGGTGLGLSIAQWIADKHDMKINLESDLGKGTKFILTMPLYNDNDEKIIKY